MLGRATFMTVLSSPMITSERDSTARIFQRFPCTVEGDMAMASGVENECSFFILNRRFVVKATIEGRMPKVTEEHVEARRRQILSAALRCFARQGFHRTTMQDIFREADLSPGAVYSYFKSKDELVAAIIGATMGF